MANILDAFFVEIGLDPAKFKKGSEEIDKGFAKTKDSAKKAADDIEQSGTRAADSISKLKGQVAALFAVFTGGIALKDFVQQLTQTDSQLGRLASTIGISGRTLSTFEGAAELAGGSAQGMASAFQGLTMEIQNWQATGQTSLIASFQAIEKAGGKLLDVSKPVDQIMRDIIEDLGQIAAKGNPAYASYLAQRLGMQDLAAALIQGGDAWRKYLALAEQYAASKEDLDAAKDRLSIWRELKLMWESIGRDLLTTLTPALLAMGRGLKMIGEWAKEHKTVVLVVFGALGALFATLTVGTIAATVASIAAAFWLLGTAISLTAGVVLAISAGIAVLGATAAVLIANWDKVGPWWHSLWDGMLDRVRRFWDSITSLFKEDSLVGRFMRGFMSSVGAVGGFLGGLVSPDGANVRGGVSGGLGGGGLGAKGEGVAAQNYEGLKGSEFLAGQRSGMRAETDADPTLKKKLAAMMVLEGANDPLPVMESLANRTAYVNEERKKRGLAPLSLDQMLNSGFYGPINRGQLPGAMGQIDRNPALQKRMNDAIDKVFQGSNLLKGATDQGMPSDPNGAWMGGRIQRGGNIFNDWGGGPGGHAGSEAFRLRQQKAIEQGGEYPLGRPGSDVPLPPSRPQFDGLKGADKTSAIMGGSALASSASYDNSRQQVTTTTMGDVHVHTAATDSLGIAKDLRDHLQRVAFAGQLDYGINGA